MLIDEENDTEDKEGAALDGVSGVGPPSSRTIHGSRWCFFVFYLVFSFIGCYGPKHLPLNPLFLVLFCKDPY